ncbi:MAG: helix-turn-helix domain-containing protein, partial [Clostridia bacterium]|nr:helix-turn-helix domain-containing protein [Clostridia bacterium]
PEENVWLWSVGYEKSTPDKIECNRILQERCVVHYCTNGKGYYNGTLITAGMAFVSWHNTAHTIKSDPNDPFEFYWIMIRGKEVSSFLKEFSFKLNNLVFECDYINCVIPLIECMLNIDYCKVCLRQYSSAMMKAILSFQINRCRRLNSDIEVENGSLNLDYIDSAKNILYDSNFTMSVEQLANMLAVTPQHLSHIFSKTIGESPKQYITRKRLELGKELLDRGIAPTTVAHTLKYNDYVSFYRAFLKKYKISPNDYLKKASQRRM